MIHDSDRKMTFEDKIRILNGLSVVQVDIEDAFSTNDEKELKESIRKLGSIRGKLAQEWGLA